MCVPLSVCGCVSERGGGGGEIPKFKFDVTLIIIRYQINSNFISMSENLLFSLFFLVKRVCVVKINGYFLFSCKQ